MIEVMRWQLKGWKLALVVVGVMVLNIVFWGGAFLLACVIVREVFGL